MVSLSGWEHTWFFEEELPQIQFAYHINHLACPGNKTVFPRLKSGTAKWQDTSPSSEHLTIKPAGKRDAEPVTASPKDLYPQNPFQ
jgi:hypothetical protein